MAIKFCFKFSFATYLICFRNTFCEIKSWIVERRTTRTKDTMENVDKTCWPTVWNILQSQVSTINRSQVSFFLVLDYQRFEIRVVMFLYCKTLCIWCLMWNIVLHLVPPQKASLLGRDIFVAFIICVDQILGIHILLFSFHANQCSISSVSRSEKLYNFWQLHIKHEIDKRKFHLQL